MIMIMIMIMISVMIQCRKDGDPKLLSPSAPQNAIVFASIGICHCFIAVSWKDYRMLKVVLAGMPFWWVLGPDRSEAARYFVLHWAPKSIRRSRTVWALVKGFTLSYHNTQAILFTIDPYYGNLP